MSKFIKSLLALSALVSSLTVAGNANAALTLTINNYTSDDLSLSISGAFDANTIGDSAGYLAIKKSWSSNVGAPTAWFSGTPSVFLNSITIGGLATSFFLQDGGSTWMDNVFWSNPFGTETSILAGTIVSGTLQLHGVGMFNPADAGLLELVSGFSRPAGHDDWVRLEATADVPEPESFALIGLALAALAVVRRKKAA